MSRAGKTARPILNKAQEKHIYNQEELAERMGWSIPTCSKKINNPLLMTLAEAQKLCKLTGITVDELITIGGKR